MMRKLKIIIIPLLAVYSSLSSQDKKFDITLKSPDAAQISKFTDMPSSTYTGVASSNILLYDIQIDNQSFPITINYHSSGVKVKEVASRVGLGWSLSIGNTSLSKQIFGSQDAGWVPNIPMDTNHFTPNDVQSNSYPLAVSITGFNQETGEQNLHKRDTQPDIFSYSVNGTSGEFHYDHTGKIIQIPYQKVKIESIFKITDDRGVIFNFTAGNSVRNLGGGISNGQDIHITDYIIQSVVYPSGKKIEFEYENVSAYGYLSNYTKRYSYPMYGCVTQVASGGSAQNEYDEYATYSNVLQEYILKKIIFPEGEIAINYNTREDIVDGKKISGITIKDKNQRLIQNYQFNQTYFISTEYIDVLNYVSQTTSLMKRLKLDGLVETVENKRHQFEYYEDNPLPNRFSNATDYLGFYNGQNTNSGIEYVEYDNQIYGLGDNKEPDINFAKLGLLKKIKYPTGGCMELEYENDNFHFNDYEKSITRYDVFIQNSDPIQIISAPSSLSEVNFKVNFASTINPLDDGSGSLPVGPHFIGEILDTNNNVLKTFLVVKDYNFLLPAQANYKVRIRKSGSIPNSDYASLQLEWFNVQSQLKDYDKSIGGIRIKKIIKKDSDNSNALIQNYKYTLENNRTSGEYFGDKIDYYYFSKSPFGDFGASCERLIITNSGNTNLTSINGKTVAYNRVITEVENIAGAENYKTIDYFTNSPSTNYNSGRKSFFQYDNNQYMRGILNKKEFYNSSNRLLERQEFNYESDYKLNEQSADYLYSPDTTIQPYVITIVGMVYQPAVTGNFPAYYQAIFEYARYSINSSWVKLKSQKNTRYFDNNQNLVETSNYLYDNTYKHLNPTSLIIENSDNSFTETTYSYAHEKGNQYLIGKNMIGIPLETTVIKKTDSTATGKLVSKSSVLFPTSQTEADQKTSGFALPYEMQSAFANAALSKEFTYDQYDDKGNVIQYTSKDGIPTTIVWGYNKTQPIAKIVGAEYSAVSSSISTIVNASNTDASNPSTEPALISALDSFRKEGDFSDYQITTYTYDPLIGVTSITPPSGIREVYLYDSANRLMEIRENNAAGKLIKEFKYNYKH